MSHSGNPFVRLAAAAGFLVVLSACASGRQARTPNPSGTIRVVVENTNWLDITVYAQTQGGLRTRLGTVGTGQTRTFRLSPGQTGGGGNFRLVGDPIGSRDVATTAWLNAAGGTVATWKIGSSAATSFAMIR